MTLFFIMADLIVHFLSRERKRNQKKTPVSRLILRVVDGGGACRNSPAFP